MMPSGLKATEWAPLALVTSVFDCLLKSEFDISVILKDVNSLFYPTPSVINTDFPEQLRINTDQPARALMLLYSSDEDRVLREHIKELYEAGYA
ncbi:hypothetical protein AYI68_g6939 [Smittium mucronatum]|uniref:Uncharacterized protein n=1 Tax=Smittium mucronatum TaxID=133383 RepID=A0A1R0GQ28_9FUNG|nr:hypothetical protein AYI68_g6939 [Smittium mucronatum]